MKITAENYEQRALDYLEGTLSPSEREAFERFLATDSRAAQQIRSLEEYMPVARAEKIAFPDPASLSRGRRVTPLRRLLSLVSGAAAAALIAGSFMLLDRAADPAPTAGNHSARTVVSPATQTVLAQGSAAQPVVVATSAEDPTDNLSEAVSPADVPARNATPGTSRLSEWNRKTAGLLKRMEERSKRHSEQAQLMADVTRPKAAPSPASAPQPKTEGLLVAASEPRHKAAFMTERAKEHSRATQDDATENSLSLLPPDATMPILTESSPLREEYQTREYWLSDEPRSRREGGLLRALLSPIEKISPIKYYETEEGRGVEIVSIIRIGSRNN